MKGAPGVSHITHAPTYLYVLSHSYIGHCLEAPGPLKSPRDIFNISSVPMIYLGSCDGLFQMRDNVHDSGNLTQDVITWLT